MLEEQGEKTVQEFGMDRWHWMLVPKSYTLLWMPEIWHVMPVPPVMPVLNPVPFPIIVLTLEL